MNPLIYFSHDRYRRHNQRRQEHLATLGLPLAGKRVLELGAGIGDHTGFFIDRGCTVTVSDARSENLEVVAQRYPDLERRVIDLDFDLPAEVQAHDVVYAYGLLYHLGEPEVGLRRMSALTGELLLLETCVSFGDDESVNMVREDPNDMSQAMRGRGCRPTRPWVFGRLQELFDHVYVPLTQPWHEEFPTDWTASAPSNLAGLYRAVFVAARKPLQNPMLIDRLPAVQERQ